MFLVFSIRTKCKLLMNKKLKTIIKLITKNSKEPHQVSESFPGNGVRKRVDTFDPD